MKPLGTLGVGYPSAQPARPSPTPLRDPVPLDFTRMKEIEQRGGIVAAIVAGLSQARTIRVHQAGGALTEAIVHPQCKSFEFLYRVQPTDAMFEPALNPEQPVFIELGAYVVPQQMVLFLFDTSADIYVPDGIIPTDCRQIENRRLSHSLGWYVSINGVVPANVQYQIEPLPAQTGSQGFVPQSISQGTVGSPAFAGLPSSSVATTPQQVFAQARGRRFAQAGPGLSLQPQRRTHVGARDLPFLWIAKAGDVVRSQLFVFRALGTPVCFFEYSIAGMLLPANWAENLVDATRPGDLIP